MLPKVLKVDVDYIVQKEFDFDMLAQFIKTRCGNGICHLPGMDLKE